MASPVNRDQSESAPKRARLLNTPLIEKPGPLERNTDILRRTLLNTLSELEQTHSFQLWMNKSLHSLIQDIQDLDPRIPNGFYPEEFFDQIRPKIPLLPDVFMAADIPEPPAGSGKEVEDLFFCEHLVAEGKVSLGQSRKEWAYCQDQFKMARSLLSNLASCLQVARQHTDNQSQVALYKPTPEVELALGSFCSNKNQD